jgi:hypothetical protein
MSIFDKIRDETNTGGFDSMTSSTDSGRPEPLLELSRLVGPAIGLATVAVGVATNLGALSSKTGGRSAPRTWWLHRAARLSSRLTLGTAAEFPG